MSRAAVRILHPEPAAGAGELTRLLAQGRALVAEALAGRFLRLGADDLDVRSGPPGAVSFGERLRGLAGELDGRTGLVVLGSGSIPLVMDDDLRALLATAASGERRALTNNRYSSDVVAVGDAAIVGMVPDIASDNALPRWLEEAGVPVEELPDRDRLALDLDSPLDLELLRRHPACPAPLKALAAANSDLLARVAETFDALAAIARDPRAELLVAGRLSASALRALEVGTACRIRALVEERGLRTAAPGQRPPASTLGLLLDREGPGAIGAVVERLADGALLDTRVPLAHRLGADESAWPGPEDRYASDLLLADRIADPWLRDLTRSAASHRLPIALGGHTLVGPGLGLALGIAPPLDR
ncbi:MAG TPA: hypothetical protein VNL94_02990 [Candidatus Binatia bacterium]|nr:hypothetical protein [Candidatus Binatia bacterium]